MTISTTMPPYDVVNVRPGDDRYADLIGQIGAPEVQQQTWADAETRLTEHPDKIWTVVVVDGAPVAWCAAQPVDGLLVCTDHYERRGVGRELRLWRVACLHRHETVIAPSGLPAVAYVYNQPRALLRALGWYETGEHGISTAAGEPHEWWQMRRDR